MSAAPRIVTAPTGPRVPPAAVPARPVRSLPERIAEREHAASLAYLAESTGGAYVIACGPDGRLVASPVHPIRLPADAGHRSGRLRHSVRVYDLPPDA